MLLRMPLQPRGNIPPEANITFLEDSFGHNNKTSNISICRFSIYVLGLTSLKSLKMRIWMDGRWNDGCNLKKKKNKLQLQKTKNSDFRIPIPMASVA